VITPEAVVTADRTLVIDQTKYFAFEVDDVDARQARGNVIDGYMTEAAFAMADVADQFLAATMVAGISATNKVNRRHRRRDHHGRHRLHAAPQAGQKLDEANVPGEW